MDDNNSHLEAESIKPSEKKCKTGQRSGLSGNHGKSEVWDHFSKHFIEGTKEKYAGTCHCNYCQLKIDAPTSNGTKKLWNHLEKNCKKLGFRDTSQTLISLTGSQVSNWAFDQEKCRKSLVKMIVLCELPFSHVEHEGFRMFCQDLQPKFHVIARTTVTRDCLLLFHEEKLKLKNYFEANPTRVCLTTDFWTSIQNLPYMVVTSHFIDHDWKIHKRIINFCCIPHPHKGEAIAKTLEECLLGWGLQNKVFTITIDNAPNNDKCVQELIRRLNKRDGLVLKGELLHIRCLAHVINLVVKSGIENVIPTIKRLRRSVKYVRSSPSRFQDFKACVVEESLTTKKYLSLDCKTRWNSTYIMINAALFFVKAFERLEDKDSFYKYKVDRVLESDWNKLKSLHTFLEEFYEITKCISGSNYITSITYLDEVTQVKGILDAHLNSDDVEFCIMAKLMNEKFEKYCQIDKLHIVLVVALVLDPRSKLQYVRWKFGKHLDETNLNEFVNNLKTFISRLYEEYKSSELAVSLPVNTIGGMSNVGGSGKVAKHVQDRAEFHIDLKRMENVDTTNDLEKYLFDRVEVSGENFDVLSWWKDKISTYNSLALMARDVLSIPITFVASE